MGIYTGGPAFPIIMSDVNDSNPDGAPFEYGMTLRAYAAIKLRVPDSGEGWLDEMILSAKRDDFAGMALQGLLACNATYGGKHDYRAISADAYAYAYEMLKERAKDEI